MAAQLDLDPFEIRKRNAYQNGQLTPYGQEITHSQSNNIFAKLVDKANYAILRKGVAKLN